MSKKQLLSESEIRRFMKLANLEPLTKNVLSEESQAVARIQGDPAATSLVQPQSEMMSYDEADETPGDEEPMGDEGGEDVELDMEEGGGDLMELLEMLKSMLKPEFAEQLDIQAGDDDDGEGEDMSGPPEDMSGPPEDMEGGGGEGEEMQELEEKKKAKKETTAAKHKETSAAKSSAAKKTKKESVELSEDGLVEAILARVTARLMQEAKKKKVKKSAKDEMEAKKKKKMMEEATDAKNGGPLLSKGGNKHDTYKGHPDMEYGKGEKGGKGGHAMEMMSAKAEHTVTHGGKNLATLGGNKTKT